MDGRPFYAEDKLDGIRAQVHKSGDGPDRPRAIYTRTMDRTDASFPDVVEAVRRCRASSCSTARSSPGATAASSLRPHPEAPRPQDADPQDSPREPCRVRRVRPALSRRRTSDGPAVERAARAVCRSWRGPGRPSPSAPRLLTTAITEVITPEQIAAAFDAARQRRNEGIVLKDPESPYSPGRRGQAWLKVKTHLPTFDCVVTAAETGHGKRRNWLSDYTFAVWDRDPALPDAQLVNVGKAYSGVTDEEIVQLTDLFTQPPSASTAASAWSSRRSCWRSPATRSSAAPATRAATRFVSPGSSASAGTSAEDADRLARIVEIYEKLPQLRPPHAPRPAPARPRTDAVRLTPWTGAQGPA